MVRFKGCFPTNCLWLADRKYQNWYQNRFVFLAVYQSVLKMWFRLMPHVMATNYVKENTISVTHQSNKPSGCQINLQYPLLLTGGGKVFLLPAVTISWRICALLEDTLNKDMNKNITTVGYSR